MDRDRYIKIGFITGLIVFLGIWIYALFAWGFLLGLAVGWLPALIGGFIAGLLWPVVFFVVAGLVLLALFAVVSDL